MSLEWDEIPCLERNANIDQYRIFGYRGNNIRTTPEILGTAISQDTIHTATGLRPDTEYSFFVYAVYYDDNNRGPYQGGHSNTLTLLTQSKFYKVYIVLKCRVYISESWIMSYLRTRFTSGDFMTIKKNLLLMLWMIRTIPKPGKIKREFS